jgi:hypothetical protein
VYPTATAGSTSALPEITTMSAPLKLRCLTIVALTALATSQIGAQRRLPARRLTTADIALKATPATATVIALGASGDTISQGSAFVIRADGVVLTNYHVLRGASSAIVTLASHERFTRVRVVDADSSLDLALLRVPAVDLASLTPRTSAPRAGEKVVAIGSPMGLSSSVSEGIVSATRIIDGHELIQITAPISPGSSGGAVLDAEGRVFAVSTSYLQGGQSLNFAVPVKYAMGLLNDPAPERAIAEVFASHAVANAGRAPTPAALAAAMRRARAPRADVGGVYQIWENRRDSAGTILFSQRGFLIATKDVGLFVLAPVIDSARLGPTQIFGVSRWATNSAGDVVLTIGSLSYDGYQTDDSGFVASAVFPPINGEKRRSSLGAVPARLPMSRNDGLFSAHVRTWYKIGDRATGAPMDWTGDMAVGFAAGTMYLSLALQNATGGNTSFFAVGKLNGDSFELSDGKGKELKGTIRSGVLRADWLDRREGNGSFSGTLVAERR